LGEELAIAIKWANKQTHKTRKMANEKYFCISAKRIRSGGDENERQMENKVNARR